MKGIGLILNHGITLSLRTRFQRKKSIFFDILKKYNEKMTERFISRELKNIFRVNFHKFLIGLTIDGKYVWQQDEEQKGDISTALMFSELFKDIQDAILLILHYRTM